MQQLTETPPTDAAAADVITSPDAAARKCPECEALMELETEDKSGHHEPEDDGPFRPLLRCPNEDCGHIELLRPDADDATGETPAGAKSLACQACGLQILASLLGGEVDGPIRGFAVLEHRLRQEVRAAEEEFEEKNAAAKEAKKDLERVQELLGKLMDENERREREAGLERRGTLLPEQNSVCLYEQRTGQPCFICREARKRTKEAEDHDEQDLRVASLHEHLARRGVYLTEFELQAMSELQTLEDFAHDETKKQPPAFVVDGAHVAAAAGDERQTCERCGVTLVDGRDIAEGNPFHPEGAFVGLDCAGVPGDEATDVDEPEPARQPQRRHKTPAAAAQAKSQGTRAAKAEKPAKPKAAKKTRARSR